MGLGGIGETGLCGLQVFIFMVENFGGCRFFHVCTDGTQLPWLFRDTDDFLKGHNRVGVCKILSNVQVYSFTLMDNHVHFVLQGTMPQCKDFINRYKHLTGKLISAKWGMKEYVRGLKSQIIPIDNLENLLDTIGYIDRNPVVAGFDRLPSEYQWGSARLMFTDACKEMDGNVACLLGNLPLRKKWKLLGTRIPLPDNWMVDDSGMILPQCFMDISKVESLFKTPNRYMYFLSRKIEGKIDNLIAGSASTFIPDKFLRPIVGKLAWEMFGISEVNTLKIASRMVLARKLRYEYAASVKQISRMLYLNSEVLNGYL